MNLLIIGNIISFIGAMIMVSIGLIKKKKHIVIAQVVQFTIMGIGNLVLGGVTGFISNLVSIARNLVCLKWKFTLPFKIIFILAQIGMAVAWNNKGLIGWMPIVAACVFTWFLDTENEVLLKGVIIFTEVLWIIYDICLMNFASLTFDVLTIITNTISIFMIMTKGRKETTLVEEE